MRLNKIFIFLGIFLIILTLEFVSARDCSITERSSCTDNIVMGLSSDTNAHGELASEGNYPYVLCCDFGSGNTECTGLNKMIGLFSDTNAHAEIPDNTNYNVSVCYEELTCTSSSGSCPSEYPIEMISLTDETNAHIGDFEDYNIKICCSYRGGIPLDEPYWTDEDGDIDLNKNGKIEETEEIVAIVGRTKLFATILNSTLSEGEVVVDIYENVPFGFDNYIRTLIGTVDSYGTMSLPWVAQQKDIDETSKENPQFYFKINDDRRSNNEVKFNIVPDFCIEVTNCMHYETEEECNQDVCEIGDDCVIAVDCSLPEYDCCCKWNETEEECQSYWEAHGGNVDPFVCGNGIEEKGEQCDLGDRNGDEDSGCSENCEYVIEEPPCPEGLTLCADGTCSLNCDYTDDGTVCNYDGVCDDNEGCACEDCNTEIDQCEDGLTCSLVDRACCSSDSDGYCNPYCSFVDPDCDDAVCGNGIEEKGEQCDLGDRNGVEDSGCSENCEYVIEEPPCPEGLSLCADGTCSLNCDYTDDGTVCNYDGVCDDNEGCACEDCNGERDYCSGDLLCSLVDRACCSSDSDGYCNPYCSFVDPDCGEGIEDIPEIGVCTYHESTNDDCEDGFLTYSWTGNWKWDKDNILNYNPDGADYLEDEEGWHYDPERKNELCKDGEETIPCPAQIELPFFTFYSFIITLLIISLIYFFYNFRNKK